MRLFVNKAEWPSLCSYCARREVIIFQFAPCTRATRRGVGDSQYLLCCKIQSTTRIDARAGVGVLVGDKTLSYRPPDKNRGRTVCREYWRQRTGATLAHPGSSSSVLCVSSARPPDMMSPSGGGWSRKFPSIRI